MVKNGRTAEHVAILQTAVVWIVITDFGIQPVMINVKLVAVNVINRLAHAFGVFRLYGAIIVRIRVPENIALTVVYLMDYAKSVMKVTGVNPVKIYVIWSDVNTLSVRKILEAVRSAK